LFCSLNLLFGDVFVAVAVVVCLSSLLKFNKASFLASRSSLLKLPSSLVVSVDPAVAPMLFTTVRFLTAANLVICEMQTWLTVEGYIWLSFSFHTFVRETVVMQRIRMMFFALCKVFFVLFFNFYFIFSPRCFSRLVLDFA